jgi:hypothetical protein
MTQSVTSLMDNLCEGSEISHPRNNPDASPPRAQTCHVTPDPGLWPA